MSLSPKHAMDDEVTVQFGLELCIGVRALGVYVPDWRVFVSQHPHTQHDLTFIESRIIVLCYYIVTVTQDEILYFVLDCHCTVC